MATISEMFVEIGADASQFQQETQNMQQQMQGMQSEMQSMAASMGTSTAQMTNNWQHMSNEMRNAYRAQQEAMRPFRQQQQEVEYGFFQMAQGMRNYSGSTRDFMGDLQAMGNRQRQVNDAMMANNTMALTGFIQGVATMLARSAASDKIAANFARMGNPLYTVNNGLLRISAGLEGIARRGSPAVLALEMLGPTANMKQLADMTRLITQGLMRFQMVAMAALVANALMFAGLHKAALESVPGYKAALEEMGASVRKAFQPMVDVFAAVMTKIYELITWVANLAIAFNEAHPTLAKIIQGFLMLIPLLTLILSPLAIGIGLTMGLRAAFASVWMMIGPLVTGLASMMMTVILVAAAIALITAALVLLWKKNEGFRNAVIGAWEAIRAAAITIWNTIYSGAIKPAIEAITRFVTEKMEQLRTFWAENGTQIKQAASNVWNAISTVIKVVIAAIMAVMVVAWPLIKLIIEQTWNAIKMVIDGAINVILGIIKFFSALFTGDWKGLWEATKQILIGAVQLILGWLQLSFFGGILKGAAAFGGLFKSAFTAIWAGIKTIFTSSMGLVKNIVVTRFTNIVSFVTGLGKTFYNAGKGLIEMMAKGIESAASAVINTVKSLAGKVRDFLPFSPAKTGPLSDLDHLDFGGPIADSLKRGMPTVKGLMGDMFALPGITAPDRQMYSINSMAMNRAAQTVVIELDGRVIAKGTLPHMEREIRLKTGVTMG